MSFTGAFVFFATLFRFRFRKYNLFWLMCMVSVALGVGANTRQGAILWKFPVYWIYYALIASAVLALTGLLVLPHTAGRVIRGSLAAALESLGGAIVVGFGIMSGEVDESTGLLKARSGVRGVFFGGGGRGVLAG